MAQEHLAERIKALQDLIQNLTNSIAEKPDDTHLVKALTDAQGELVTLETELGQAATEAAPVVEAIAPLAAAVVAVVDPPAAPAAIAAAVVAEAAAKAVQKAGLPAIKVPASVAKPVAPPVALPRPGHPSWLYIQPHMVAGKAGLKA
jgi:hypothetical protein